jgi:hypothetical protein
MNRALELLLRGAKITGTFTEGFNYIYENLYTTDDVNHLSNFCEWLDKEIGGAGRANIEKLYWAFDNRESTAGQTVIEHWKEIINKFKPLKKQV